MAPIRSLLFLALLVPLAPEAQQRESTRLAAEAEAAKADLFHKLDTNADGTLSRSELAAPAAQDGNWIAIDRDGDGRISPSEFTMVRRLGENATAVGGTRPPAYEEEPATGAGRP